MSAHNIIFLWRNKKSINLDIIAYLELCEEAETSTSNLQQNWHSSDH